MVQTRATKKLGLNGDDATARGGDIRVAALACCMDRSKEALRTFQFHQCFLLDLPEAIAHRSHEAAIM
jgi:hypothetical protein